MRARSAAWRWGWLAGVVAIDVACTLTHDVDALSRGAGAGGAATTAATSKDAGAGGAAPADAGAGGSPSTDAGAGGAAPTDAGADADAAAPPCGDTGEACCPIAQGDHACSNPKARCCWACDAGAGFHCNCSDEFHAAATCKLCCIVCANGFAADYGLPVPDGGTCDQLAQQKCTADHGSEANVDASGWKDTCK